MNLQPNKENLFPHLDMAQEDPIPIAMKAFNNDPSSEKINLGVGAYRDSDEKPYVFKVVQKVEQELFKKGTGHEYFFTEGSEQFCKGARNVLFGSESSAIKDHRIASCQTLSGTGALSLGKYFLKDYLPRIIYISDPTWQNHKGIIQMAGLKWIEYPYYNPKTKGLNIPAMLQFLQNAVSGSIVLLHVCAHNPTGVDPTVDQWKQIAAVMKSKSLIPFFDCAYQGFATGDLEKDAWPVRYFIDEGFQMFVAQSFAKNMGLYGERIGALHVVTNCPKTSEKVMSQIRVIARKNYLTPPIHGAFIAAQILNNVENFKAWEAELRDVVVHRIIEIRRTLRIELQKLDTPGTWNHISDQIGMFSFTGLTEKQCETLINKFHVHLLKSGRISMVGVNHKNVKYLAKAIFESIKENPQ